MDLLADGRERVAKFLAGFPVIQPAELWLQLHTGDMGQDGNDNIASIPVRYQISTVMPLPDGVIHVVNSMLWGPFDQDEVISHVSIWDDETAGVAVLGGALDEAQAIPDGGFFDLPLGSTIELN